MATSWVISIDHLSAVAATAASGNADGGGGALLARSDTLVISGTDRDAGRVGDGGGAEHRDNGEDHGGELHLDDWYCGRGRGFPGE